MRGLGILLNLCIILWYVVVKASSPHHPPARRATSGHGASRGQLGNLSLPRRGDPMRARAARRERVGQVGFHPEPEARHHAPPLPGNFRGSRGSHSCPTPLILLGGKSEGRAGGHKVEGARGDHDQPRRGSHVDREEEAGPSGISCHAWNGDRLQGRPLPLQQRGPRVREGNNGSTSLRASSRSTSSSGGVDWSPTRDMIVTCAHDRNATCGRRERRKGERARRDKPRSRALELVEER